MKLGYKEWTNGNSDRGRKPEFWAAQHDRNVQDHTRSHLRKWSMEIEQKFGQHTTVSLSYEGNHGYHEFVADPGMNGL